MTRLSLSEQLAYSTVRIESELVSGGRSVGTGFFFYYGTAERSIPTIVTNKHVIQGARTGRFSLTPKKAGDQPDVGNVQTIELNDFEKRWIGHPDSAVDLCVMPMGPVMNEAHTHGFSFFHVALDKKIIASPQVLADLGALEDIIMVGYPIGIWDATNNLPVFRDGITATHANVDYNGQKEFLIDCACFPGSSGSPVFLYNLGTYQDREGNTNVGTRCALLGILYAGPQFPIEGQIKVVPIPTQLGSLAISHIPINLGFVIKAERLLDFEPILTRLAAGEAQSSPSSTS